MKNYLDSLDTINESIKIKQEAIEIRKDAHAIFDAVIHDKPIIHK